MLGLIAVLLAFIGGSIPFMLPSQAAKDRAYYQNFQAAAAHIDRNGKLNDTRIGGWKGSEMAPLIRSSIDIPIDCDPRFIKAPDDTLVLSFWRGEWTECYAYPSGGTTLSMSVRAYMLSGVGMNVAVYWLLAIGAAWGAIRMWRTPVTSGRRTANNS